MPSPAHIKRRPLTTPDVSVRPEVELLDVSSRGLEPVLRVLRGDAARDDVALRLGLALNLDRLRVDEVKVDLTGGVRVETVESPDVADLGERDTHRDLELSRGEVDARDHLGCRMLDLKTRVKLKEEEGVVGVRVQI